MQAITATGGATAARRGRPTIVHDNRRVRAFIRRFDSAFDLAEELPTVDDALTGITHLQTEGQGSTRPLSKRILFRALRECEGISSQSVAAALGRDFSRASVGRYTAIARVASKAIERILDLRPDWERCAGGLAADRTEIDAPYRAELAACDLV
jgi:hypothetical protein